MADETIWRRPCDTLQCIEVATDVPGLRDGDIAIRNSQQPGTVVVASAEEYAAWVADVSAPLAAELAEAMDSMYDYQHGATRADEERDQARADRDVAEREMERYRQEAHDLVAELAEVTRERDEAREAGIREGREAAAQDIRQRAHAIDIEPQGFGPRATRRRHLLAAARIAAGAMTPQEAVEAIGAGQAIVCRTADIEPGGDEGSGT